MRAAILLATLTTLTPKPDVTASNDFAFSMYGAIRAQKGNVLFSPVSVREALGAAYVGARGDTAKEMSTAVHLDRDAAKSADAAKDEAAELKAAGATLQIANRLWVDSRLTPKPAFAGGTPLDFRNHADPSRLTINDWVQKQTNDRIKDLLPAGSVDSSTRCVITNAIWFKGDWASPFAKESTSDATFLVGGATATKVPTMHQDGSFKIADANDAKMLEMPYANSTFAMDVLLPNANDGIGALEAKVVKTGLDPWTSAFTSTQVDVAFPKVQFSWGTSLSKPLASLGMKQAFDGAKADFTGIADRTDGENLYVSDVFHKAFVAIDEKGTEAAAATAAVFAAANAVAPVRVIPFHADHPFLVVIRDVKTQRIVFMGRVSDPRG